MAASRCLQPFRLSSKRLKLHTFIEPPRTATLSTSCQLHRAQTIDDPTNTQIEPSNQTPKTADPKSITPTDLTTSTQNADSPRTLSPSYRPLRPQDEIKNELIKIAFERHIPIPPELDPSAPDVRLPRSIQALYLAPLRRPVTHGIPVANLQLRSYSVRNLEFMADFAMRAAYYLDLPAKGPVPLPKITERWTVPRSHFIFKKSQENWERVTTRRLVQILDGDPEVVRRWLGFLRKWCWYGVGMKADVFEYEGTDVVKRMDETAAQAASKIEGVNWAFFGRRKGLGGKADVEKLLDEQGFGESSSSSSPPPPPVAGGAKKKAKAR